VKIWLYAGTSENLELLVIIGYHLFMIYNKSDNVSSADNQQERLLTGGALPRKWLSRIPPHIGYYLAGFVDGEGSFNVSLRRKKDYRRGWQPVLSFNVSQKDIKMLVLLKQYLGCGIIKQRRRDGLYSYDVTNPKEITEKVLPFFNLYKFLSVSKIVNYSIFKKISKKMEQKRHLNRDGLIEILELREKLNEGKGRTRKYTIIDVLN